MSRPAALARLVQAASALLLMAAAPASAPGLQELLRAREAARSASDAAGTEAAARAAQADRLAAARSAAAADLRATEDALAIAADRIAALQQQVRSADAATAAQTARLTPLLPLIERLGLYPAETLLSVPGSPEDAVRGVVVLQSLTRRIRTEISELATRQALATEVSRRLEHAQEDRSATAARQRAQAEALDLQLNEATRRRDQAQDEAARAARAAAEAAARTETLRAAVATLDTARRRSVPRPLALMPQAQPAAPQLASTGAPFAAAAASGSGWSAPVAGHVTRAFGSGGEAGPASGITVVSPPGARVVAPCAGQVAFAGPFRSYGQLLIVQCSGGVHAVLAGLGRLDAAIGQLVRGGEPLGIMPASGGALYIEARRAGLAVDPQQYLRTKG